MSLARSGLVAFCRGGVWLASKGQLVVCLDICIVRDGRLLSFVANDRVLCLPAILRVSFAKIVPFFLPGPEDDHFHIASAQRDPAIPSSALLVSPTSPPYLDANEEIGLRATESPDCLSLQLCQTN